MRPYLRVANVFEDRIDTTDVKQMDFTDCFDSYKLEVGDVLLNEGQSPQFLGRPAIYRGIPRDVAFTNTLIRFRAGPDVTPEWALTVFRQYMHSGRFARESRITTNIAHLSASRFKSVEFPIPPLDEQRRIVAILDDHLSRLAAADQLLDASAKRAKTLLRTALWSATHLPGDTKRMSEIADVKLGRQRSPKNHSGADMVPYLRAANVDWNRLRLDDVKSMNFTAAERETFTLRDGDILLTEASGSPGEVGKSVVYRGEPPGVCFQNTVLRVRCFDANPDFVQRYLLSEAYAGRFVAESRGVGIHHLGRTRLSSWPISLPDRHTQDAAVEAADELLLAITRLATELAGARRRGDGLKRALLAKAFSGELVPTTFPAKEQSVS